MGNFLHSYQGISTGAGPFPSILTAYIFFLITITLNVITLSRSWPC